MFVKLLQFLEASPGRHRLNQFGQGCVPTCFALCIFLGTLVPLTSESPVVTLPCPNVILSSCTCERRGNTWVKVNCTNTNFKTVDPLHSIPNTVESVVFTGNDIPVLYPNVMGNSSYRACRDMPFLTALDLSRNNIRVIKGKAFHCMKNLEILILNDNQWEPNETIYTRTFSSLVKLKTLHLQNSLARGYSYSHLKQIFIDSFAAEPENENLIEEIHMENNHLNFFHADLFCGLENLRRIYLSNNNISTPQINYQCARQMPLEAIYLDYNNITFFPTSFLDSLSMIPTLRTVNFSHNPLQCDCSFIRSFRWLMDSSKSSFVAEKEHLTCAGPVEYENVVIISGQKEGITEEDLTNACKNKKEIAAADRARKVKTSYIILGIIFAILGVLFIAVLYLNRYKIQRELHIHIIEPIRESMLGKNLHYGYASVSV